MAETKARLSSVLRAAATGPVFVHNRGRDVAVIVSPAAWNAASAGPTNVGAWVASLPALREKHSGGGGDFTPRRAKIVARDPFASRRR